MKNPVLTASGTFGYGLEYDDFFDTAELGGICTKGLSLLPRAGNPPDRICETASGMLNAIGLANVGVEAFCTDKLPTLRKRGVTVTFVVHGGLAVPGPFDERRTGLDHLSFAVADRLGLEAWRARLDEHGVVHSDIVSGSAGDLIPFRDPDNIALELYTRPA